MDSISPILNGSLSLITGNFLGATGDRIIHTLNTRRQMVEKIAIGDASLIDLILDIFFHVGVISFTTHMVSKGLPFITEDPAAFTLFMLGVLTTSENLAANLKRLNNILLNNKEGGAEHCQSK